MNHYRFSPIKNKEELFAAIRYTHFACYKLCKCAFGKYLPNAGNIAIFCHYFDEYELLTKLRKELTIFSDNPDQKYFRLINPIDIPKSIEVPETIYFYLYIRKPNSNDPQVGDIDFYLEPEEYNDLKKSLLEGKEIEGARIYDRPDLDMIELYDPTTDALGYVSTREMTEKVRVKLSDATKL
jgi:hypothetical protein